jgi:hypothetical protein
MTQERTLRVPVTFPGIVHVSENKMKRPLKHISYSFILTFHHNIHQMF